MKVKIKLILYITGHTSKSLRAIKTLRDLSEGELKDIIEIKIIDVLEHPQLAEDDKILATPTLVKTLPGPIRRIIGDLSETEKVLLGLDIRYIEHRKISKS
jgi:circadian clock protein KaiB